MQKLNLNAQKRKLVNAIKLSKMGSVETHDNKIPVVILQKDEKLDMLKQTDRLHDGLFSSNYRTPKKN